MTRGYFGIGIYNIKSEVNIGTLWRSAFQFGASFIFTVGRRYSKQSSDTPNAIKHVPLLHYIDISDLLEHLPIDCPLIGIETTGQDIQNLCHPERATYLLGAEDHGIPNNVLAQCHRVIGIPFSRIGSLNVAVAGSIVMYDRLVKQSRDC